MPIMRNPFRNSRPVGEPFSGENLHPTSAPPEEVEPQKKQNWVSKPLSIKSNSDRSPTEYKLSEINDSGVYLPPSPPEKRPSMWSRTSTRSSSHRSQLNENEPFNISRESFDSYRRSFDISARSPVLDANNQRGRGSLDSRFTRLPPSSYPYQHPYTPTYPQAPLTPLSDHHVNPVDAEPEDRFEDVALGDDGAPKQNPHQPNQHHKRKGLFGRFVESSAASIPEPGENTSRPGSSSGNGVLGGHFFGRKRGDSGKGAELGNVHGSGHMHHHKKSGVESVPPEVKVDS